MSKIEPKYIKKLLFLEMRDLMYAIPLDSGCRGSLKTSKGMVNDTKTESAWPIRRSSADPPISVSQ